MFSPRKMLLFLLLVMPRSDPSSFSGPPGKALILDPGVSLSLCFSAQTRGRVLPETFTNHDPTMVYKTKKRFNVPKSLSFPSQRMGRGLGNLTITIFKFISIQLFFFFFYNNIT